MIDPLTGQEDSRGAWHARHALPRATVVALAGLLGILVGEQNPLASKAAHRQGTRHCRLGEGGVPTTNVWPAADQSRC